MLPGPRIETLNRDTELRKPAVRAGALFDMDQSAANIAPRLAVDEWVGTA